MPMHHEDRHPDYDSEPVKYCARCYSLKIKYEDTVDSEYCADCGCLDIQVSDVHTWEKLYEKRYGKKYLVNSYDPKRTLVFKMSIGELKTRLYNHPRCMDIIRNIYPGFPGGLSKADSILLFFDRVIKDGKLDTVRMNLLSIQNNQ